MTHRSVAAVVAALLLVAGCSSAPEPAPEPAADGVEVTGGPADLTVEPADVDVPMSADAPFEVLDAYELGPSGPLASPATLAFPIGDPPDDGDEPVVVTSESPDGPWTPLPTTFDPATGTATAVTEHFSFFLPMWVKGKTIQGALRSIVDGFTAGAFADADPAQCTGDVTAWTLQVEGDALSACLGGSDDDTVATLVNQRRYPVVVSAQAGSATLLDQQFSVAGALSQATQLPGRVVVPPGGTARYSIDQTVGLYAESDGAANSINNLFFGVQLASSFLTKFGKGNSTSFERTWNAVGALLTTSSCADAVGTGLDPAAVIPACFSDAQALGAAFGGGGALFVVAMQVGGVFSFFRSQINAFVDMTNGRDQAGVLITPTTTPTETVTVRPVTADGSPAPGYTVEDGSSWGTIDCSPGYPSGSAVDDDIYDCAPNAASAHHCWPSGPQEMLCLPDVFQQSLIRYVDEGQVEPVSPLDDNPEAAGMVLDDGAECSAVHGGAWSPAVGHDDWFVSYACSGGAVADQIVWYTDVPDGGFDRSTDSWTVVAGPVEGPFVTRHIVTRYVVGTA